MAKTLTYFMLLLAVIVGVVYLNLGHQSHQVVSNITQFFERAQLPNINIFSPSIRAAESKSVVVGGKQKAGAIEQKLQLDVKPIQVAMQQDPDTQKDYGDQLGALGVRDDAGSVENNIQADLPMDDVTIGTAEIDDGLAVDSIETGATENDDIRVLLVPDRETTIASTTAGRLVSLKGNLGQWFRAGDLLASFDCDEQSARVDITKATLSATIEEHEAKLKMQGLDQASDLEVALAASAVNKARAELKLNRSLASECKIYAPWSGRVAEAHVKNNMTVSAGEPLLDIVRTGPLKLKLNVPSKMLSSLKAGKQFNVTIDETGETYAAKIIAVNSRVDPVSQTVEIEAKMSQSYKALLAGMSGTADLSNLSI